SYRRGAPHTPGRALKRNLLATAVALAVQAAFVPAALGQSQNDADKAEGPKPPAAAAKPDPGAQKVESIVVEGQFLGTGAQSAMKQDVAVRDTPFTVQAYTASFMKAIETTNVADLYNYMTGVKRAGNTGYDLTIR